MTESTLSRYFYSESIASFLAASDEAIIGAMVKKNDFGLEPTQRDAWVEEIRILKTFLPAVSTQGNVYFEYSIPRLGKRFDVVIVIGPVLFVLGFKVGEKEYLSHAIDQVWDYALDLKNFHESSHECIIAPILIATKAPDQMPVVAMTQQNDGILLPIKSNEQTLADVFTNVLEFTNGPTIDPEIWESGRYQPTPTIIEAATALYNGHSVDEISRSDAGATNLTSTTHAISEIIDWAKANSKKAICFVTGVPGAGKTLVGLNIATKHIDADDGLHSVFLSGNGPLVAILREALARDKVERHKTNGQKVKKSEVLSEVKMFIQNVHHFRDDCLIDSTQPPIEHVAIFDEAQRSWDFSQTVKFMQQKKKISFDQSEPEFLISCLDRHPDWAVIVCLVGGGQEINTGEAGITEWIESVIRSFPDWHLCISSRLTDSEYTAGDAIQKIKAHVNTTFRDELHLAVSMRSFRAENVSLLVKQILDINKEKAQDIYSHLADRYPIVITRNLQKAKRWLKNQARGSERYGIVVSSQAQRLKPYAIDVRTKVNPIHWFLNDKTDVRSSYYLEDVVTEFQIQGLELDWACVTWDADFRLSKNGWEEWSFRGYRWNRIRKQERKAYLKNAYRVLLTRARQGMVIVVPDGDSDDPTRNSEYYDKTYEYLCEIGFRSL